MVISIFCAGTRCFILPLIKALWLKKLSSFVGFTRNDTFAVNYNNHAFTGNLTSTFLVLIMWQQIW